MFREAYKTIFNKLTLFKKKRNKRVIQIMILPIKLLQSSSPVDKVVPKQENLRRNSDNKARPNCGAIDPKAFQQGNIDDDENLNITGYNEHFSITSWIKHIRKEKFPPNNYITILEA